MASETSTTRPLQKLDLSGALCPECEHDDVGRRGWFQRVFKTAAYCPRHQDSEESGLGMPGPCGCTNRFHS